MNGKKVVKGFLSFKFDFQFQGCKIKMDGTGNILIKRIAKSNVYVKPVMEEEPFKSIKTLAEIKWQCEHKAMAQTTEDELKSLDTATSKPKAGIMIGR